MKKQPQDKSTIFMPDFKNTIMKKAINQLELLYTLTSEQVQRGMRNFEKYLSLK